MLCKLLFGIYMAYTVNVCLPICISVYLPIKDLSVYCPSVFVSLFIYVSSEPDIEISIIDIFH